jgi:hypothetical protein
MFQQQTKKKTGCRSHAFHNKFVLRWIVQFVLSCCWRDDGKGMDKKYHRKIKILIKCLKIGYNGLGFCCHHPESQSKPGACEPEPIQRKAKCPSECRSDSECSGSAKCCFDGCGLKCRESAQSSFEGSRKPPLSTEEVTTEVPAPRNDIAVVTTIHRPSPPIRPNKKSSEESSISGKKLVVIESKVGDCLPLDLLERNDCTSGTDHCQSDDQCQGVKKCCSDGCFKRCIAPYRATNCIHLKEAEPLTQKVRRLRCRKDGMFERIQCSSGLCWCVDEGTGFELQGTRTTTPSELDCDGIKLFFCQILRDILAPRICPETHCLHAQKCVHGLEKDENGCDTCDCLNMCKV